MNYIFYKLNYFQKGNSLCGADLNNKNQIEMINLSFVSSLSDLKEFRLPFSGEFRGNYAILTMNNCDKYYINENTFSDLTFRV